jgi:hypothetical protein
MPQVLVLSSQITPSLPHDWPPSSLSLKTVSISSASPLPRLRPSQVASRWPAPFN